jgi:hypothetical protein
MITVLHAMDYLKSSYRQSGHWEVGDPDAEAWWMLFQLCVKE